MNVQDQLNAIAKWLSWQDDDLKLGMRNSMDALRLYDWAKSHPSYPKYADQWTPKQRIAALGYDPIALHPLSAGPNAPETGAAIAHKALSKAKALLETGAFYTKPGAAKALAAEIAQIL